MNKPIDSWILEDWKIIPGLNLIQNHQSEWLIKPRLMKLLEFFLLNQNEVVTKASILNFVWEDRIVTENLLTKSISELRKLLEERFSDQIEIETIRNVGYRFKTSLEILPLQEGIKPNTEKTEQNKTLKPWIILLILLMLIGVFIVYTQQRAKSKVTFTVERISSLKGQEVSPTISPNGAHLAFAWRKTAFSPFHIYLRSLEEHRPRKLSSSEAIEYNPAWSPDGQHIVFMRTGGPQKVVLIKKSIIGNDEIQLTTLAPFIPGRSMQWSSDNKRLIFTGKQEKTSPSRLYAFNLETLQLEELSEPEEHSFGDIHPVFASTPDILYFIRALKGKSILAENAPKEAEIMRLDLNSMEIKSISSLEGEVKDLVYQPQLDQFLVWTSSNLGNNQLIGVRPNGDKQFLYQLQRGMPGKGSAGIDKTIYFELWQSNLNVHEYQIGTAYDSLYEAQTYLQSTMWDWGLEFANTSNDIAFISTRNGYQEIWMTSAKQPDNARQITKLKSPLIKSISLSPDGHQIVWLSIKEDQSIIYSIQANGKQLKELTSAGIYSSPQWAIDGKSIFYSLEKDGKWNIVEQEIANGSIKQITENGGHSLFISPYYKEYLYFSKLNQDTVYRKHLASSKIENLGRLKGLETINWVIHPKGIFYLAWANGLCQLYFFDFEEQQRHLVDTIAQVLPGIPSLSISPDAQKLYIARSDEINSDILSIQFE